MIDPWTFTASAHRMRERNLSRLPIAPLVLDEWRPVRRTYVRSCLAVSVPIFGAAFALWMGWM